MKQRPIPGWMAEEDLEIMAELAKQVPEDGLIVEVGSWMGQSTQCWSMNTKAQVIAIDLWKWMPKTYDGPHEDLVDLHDDPYTQFLRNTMHLENVTPMVRESSGGDWEHGDIDLVFIDAMHQNPWVRDDIGYWEPKVKPGGIICGDDYAPMFPAVIEESKALASRLGVPLETPGSKFWLVKKPH